MSVKINNQYQALHLKGSDTGHWVNVQVIERDICLLYHQLSDYSYIMDDLYYGDVYALSYWEFLKLEGIEPDQQSFIREGCLVMLLAMGLNALCGASSFSKSNLNKIVSALEKCPAEDERASKLLKIVQLTFELLKNGDEETTELGELSSWVHKEFVRGYFERIAHDFKTNPYFAST